MKITTRDELKQAIFEELGSQFHNVEITESQWENIFDKSLKKMYENDMTSSTLREVKIPMLSELDKAHLIFNTQKEFSLFKAKTEQEITDLKSLIDENSKKENTSTESFNSRFKELIAQIETISMQIEAIKKQLKGH